MNAPLPRRKEIRRASRHPVLRLSAVLPRRRPLGRSRGAAVDRGVPGPCGAAHGLRFHRLARARNGLWIRVGGGRGLPADRDSQLDRAPAGSRSGAGSARRRVGRGTGGRVVRRHHRSLGGGGDRLGVPCCVPAGRGARGDRGPQLAQPAGYGRRRDAAGRQHTHASGTHRPRRDRPPRRATGRRHGRDADLSNRRPHRSELYTQLALQAW